MGLRNSLLVAIAPTATIASIAGCYECIEPQVSNLFKRETLSGDFLQVNRYLVDGAQGARPVDRGDAQSRSSWPKARCRRIEELPEELRAVYRTAWEIPMRSLIDMAADRGAFIDQSQSLNLFIESPNIGAALVDVLLRLEEGPEDDVLPALAPGDAHRQGDRRVAATRPERGAIRAERGWTAPPAARDGTPPRACSLENPETCEACQ